MERHADDDLTQSGVTLGTFDYISPEQALEPRDADVRSDIYSLGCTFYHVLTGRPPVPEGTATKKLLHHQHVKPPDPREFVPDLPLEVVLILDRMMAKNPRDRFSSAEQLVHHLLVVARQLGTTSEVPEGVLTVEATLPNPPTSRPLMWAALAAVAVVVLVLALDQSPVGPRSTPPRRDDAADPAEPFVADKAPAAPVKTKDDGPLKTLPEQAAPARYVHQRGDSVRPLLEWIEKNKGAANIELDLVGGFDVSGPDMGDRRGLVVSATNRVVIRARDAKESVTMRLSYDAGPDRKGALVALRINAPVTEIEGVRFVLDAHESPGLEMIGLHLGAGRHDVRRCEFIQAQPALRPEGKRVASVLAAGGPGGSNRAELTLTDCTFVGFGGLDTSATGTTPAYRKAESGGQDGVVALGVAAVNASGCYFGPHEAAFRLEGALAGDVSVKASDCSLLLPARRSAVFEVPAGFAGTSSLVHSVVGRLSGPGEADGETVLIRQGGSLVFTGEDNAYHDLDAFWVTRDGWHKAGWADYRSRLTGDKQADSDSRLSPVWPWRLPEAKLLTELQELHYAQAAALNLRSAALRKHGRSTTELIGAAAPLGQRWEVPQPLPTLEPPSEEPRILVVEEGASGADGVVFGRLTEAVAAARSRDTILIRHEGELKVEPVRLDKKGLAELTIRPARRFRPRLTLDDASLESESAIFRINYSRLTLENLEFDLKPGGGEVKQAVVALVGDGEAILRDCAVTLSRVGDASLSLATLTEPGKVMKPDMPTARSRDQGPRLVLDRCLVRGDGDLLWARATRPFAMEMKQSFAALSGPLLRIDADGDAAAPLLAQKVDVSLESSTVYHSSPLIRVKVAKDVRGVVPIACDARSCLLVPATARLSLIKLTAPEGDEGALREKFTWKGSKNAYGEYASQFGQEPGAMMIPAVGMEKWKIPGEETGKFGIKLKLPSRVPSTFAETRPGQFEWQQPPEAGADPTVLPQPAGR